MGLTNKIKQLFGKKEESKEQVSNKLAYLLEKTKNIDDFIINSKEGNYIPLPEEYYADDNLIQQWNYSITAIKVIKECNLNIPGDYQITPE